MHSWWGFSDDSFFLCFFGGTQPDIRSLLRLLFNLRFRRKERFWPIWRFYGLFESIGRVDFGTGLGEKDQIDDRRLPFREQRRRCMRWDRLASLRDSECIFTRAFCISEFGTRMHCDRSDRCSIEWWWFRSLSVHNDFCCKCSRSCSC